MLRRLIVLRHAKSAWDTDAPNDHARPLNKRGKRDAPKIGARIAELGWSPDLVISSDSTRTRQTWKRMKDAFDDTPEVVFTHDFYHGTPGAIQSALARVDDKVSTVMVIGHNPSWEDAVSELCGAYLTMTTCNAALLSVEADSWRAAGEIEGGWRLVELLRPKEL